MLTPLVAGVFALAGVLLGIFLEPVKARVAARTRLREERALRSARDAVLRLFRGQGRRALDEFTDLARPLTTPS